MRRHVFLYVAALLSAGASPPEWSRPAEPFRVAGQIYYVGTEGIAVYLIRTNAGLILLDGGLAESVPEIEANITALGFRPSDVKLMIATHAHWDHAAGLAKLKQDTGASFAASAADRQAYETGIPPSEVSYGPAPFPAVKVDRVIDDGRPLRLGGVVLTPVLTPGHTPGCTTWTMRTNEAGRNLDVVFPCSITVAGNKLVDNKGYPGIVADFQYSFAKMRQLRADVVLPAHPELADVRNRARRRDAGEKDAFIAPDLLTRLVDQAEASFNRELEGASAP